MVEVPKNWVKKTVDDLFIFTNGNGFKASDWTSEGLPIIRIQNLNGSTDYNYFNGEIQDKWLVNPGQLLFAWAGTKGVSFGPKIWNGPKGLLNQHIYKLEPKIQSNRIWLYYALMRVTGIIESKAHGFKSTLLHVQKSDITKQVVHVPPVPEQEKIAEILGCWDTGIDRLEKLIAAKQKMKKALMQQLLTGKIRFKEFEGQEWKVIRFKDFMTESRILGSVGDKAKKLTVKLYGKGVVAKIEKRQGSKSTQYYRRFAGQFIYSKLDFLNGAFGIIPNELNEYESTLDLPAFDVDEKVDINWFYYFVSRKDFYKKHLGLANGGRKARRVNPKDLLKIKEGIPSIFEQKKIASVLNATDKEVELLCHKLEKLRDQKKGLMQILLTGKIRVKV